MRLDRRLGRVVSVEHVEGRRLEEGSRLHHLRLRQGRRRIRLRLLPNRLRRLCEQLALQLAASVAHDLRNPLTIVKGTAESLCRRPRTAEEVAAHTDVIRRNIEKADETIESLIDLAKPKQVELQS